MGMMWTEEQKKVIDLRNRNILVSAAAGSGKTAVLVERIIAMITDPKHPVDIDELLVVTFTKAAAAEMKERIGRALEKMRQEHPSDDRLEKQSALLGSAQITTIHSFCLHLIRNYFNEIDLDPSFRVADDIELSLLKADTVSELLEDMYEEGSEDFLSFVECYARGKTDSAIEDMMMQLYDYSRSYPWPEVWLDQCMSCLAIGSEQELEASGPVKFLKGYIQNIASDLRQQIAGAVEICKKPDGPVFYEQALNSDIRWLDSVMACETFSDLKNTFDGLSWEALSRKRMPDASEENKETVKSIRKTEKDSIAAIKKDFFFTDPGSMAADIRISAAPMRVLVRLVKEFSQRYQAAKEEKNIVDFSDLEHFALDILVRRDEDGNIKKSDAALEMSSQFAEILCDEYQDSNLVQETILNAVSREASGSPNIFMVGDVKQSIYKFRLARPELFMDKYNSYPVTDGKYQRIDLHKNFRSRSCVVDFVNLIFEHIMGMSLGGIVYDESAALYAGARFPEPEQAEGMGECQNISQGTEVLLVDLAEDSGSAEGEGPGQYAEETNDDSMEETVADKEIEARAIVSKIQQMIQEKFQVLDKETGRYRTVQYRDIVILLRTMRGWSDVFADVLIKSGIPAHSETASGFFDTLEIRTAVCMLSVIDNPVQDIELAAVLKSCIGGFSDEELAMIRSVLKKGSLYDACMNFMKPEADMVLDAFFDPAQYRKVRIRLKQFFEMLDRFRKKALYLDIHQLILEVFEETRYDELVSAMPSGQRRHANLELFIEKAVDYERTSYKGLFNFVRYIRKLRTQNSDIGEASVVGDDENVVRIVSIHKSKGLEYPVVFVSGMSKKFNKQDARNSVLIHSDYGLGPEAVDEETRTVSPTILKKAIAKKIVLESLGEELRVLYVALTRAKEKLILTGTVKDFGKAYRQWLQAARTQTPLLTFKVLSDAGGYLDWLMPVLYQQNYRAKSQAIVNIEVLPKLLFVYQQAAEMAGNQVYRAALQYEVSRHGKVFDTDQLQQHFGWRYPYAAAVNLPAKLTISEIKKLYQVDMDTPESVQLIQYEKMMTDLEETTESADTGGIITQITENADTGTTITETTESADTGTIITETDSSGNNEIRHLSDSAQRIQDAAKRGTAIHKALELADFSKIRRVDDVRKLLENCVAKGVVEQSLAGKINPWKIYKMVRSPLGQRMAAAQKQNRLFREKQFIMEVDAKDVYTGTGLDKLNETILTQGMIDAYFEEADGIVLIDYKTDFIKPGQEQILVARYKVQLDYYQMAIGKILGKKVKERYIYSFSLDKEIEA